MKKEKNFTDNNTLIIENLKTNKFYSWIPTLGLRLDKEFFHDRISMNPSIETVIKKVKSSPTNKFKIDEMFFTDTIYTIKKNNEGVETSFQFEIDFINDNDEFSENGTLKAILNDIEQEKFLVEVTFNIDSQGFVELLVTEVKSDSGNKLMDAEYIMNIMYTILKVCKHSDAHHRQKVDDINGIHIDANIDSPVYKKKILLNQINYLKKIEASIKKHFDLKKFGYSFPKGQASYILDTCSRLEGFAAYFKSYISKISYTDKIISEEEKKYYLSIINSIIDSSKSFQDRLKSGYVNIDPSTMLTAGVAVSISMGILLSNLFGTQIKETSFVLLNYQIVILAISLGLATISIAYFKDFYYHLTINNEFLIQLKYLFIFSKNYSDEYSANVSKIKIKYRILIWLFKHKVLSTIIIFIPFIVFLGAYFTNIMF